MLVGAVFFEENREISMKRPKGKKLIETKLGSSVNINRDSLHRQSVQQCGKPSQKKREPAHLVL